MQTVLVTGANRGLGLEFVRAYAADGWKVIAVCRTDQGLEELHTIAAEFDVDIEIADVAVLAEVDALAARLVDLPIDVLINNAGLFGPKAQADADLRQSFTHMDYDIWMQILRVNTLAPYKMTEALIGNLRAGTGKKVVTISSSVASIAEAEPGINAYRSSKTAVNMAMVSLAKELQAEGIAVGLFCPGWVNTRMGGEAAPIMPDASVAGMRRLIDDLTLDNSGSFQRFDGETIPW